MSARLSARVSRGVSAAERVSVKGARAPPPQRGTHVGLTVMAGMVWWAWLPGRNGNPGEGIARCILWVVARRGEAARGVGRPREKVNVNGAARNCYQSSYRHGMNLRLPKVRTHKAQLPLPSTLHRRRVMRVVTTRRARSASVIFLLQAWSWT